MRKYLIALFAGLSLVACTDKFDDMNKTKTGLTPESAQPKYVFGRNIYHGSSNDHQRNFNLYDDMYAHHFSNWLNSSEYWEWRDDWGGIFWRDFYTERLPEFFLVDEFCGDEEIYSNIKAANDIWNVILWLRIVDRYGDAPYKDAEGYAGQGRLVAYTPVEDIYKDLIARLQNDVKLLNNTSNQVDLGEYDLIYNNDFSKWQKLANTLIMRLSMRLSGTALANEAKTAFVAAYNAGGLSAAADYARVHCDASIWGDYYDRTDYDWMNTYTDEDFMKMMNGTNPGYTTGVVDPRRPIWFKPANTTPDPDPSFEGWANYSGSMPATRFSEWDGLPNGSLDHDAEETFRNGSVKDFYDADAKKWDIPASYDGNSRHGGSDSFARINTADPNGFFYFGEHTLAKSNLSWCYATWSETLFLEAEAALRGWISGNAEDLYKQAIKASMDEVCWFVSYSGGNVSISDAEKDAYIAALPAFGTGESALRNIMIQKWVALYPNTVEAWAEQRRTGYPDYYSGVVTYPKVSSNATVKSGNIIQKLQYPDNEFNTNADLLGFSSYSQNPQENGLYWSLNGKGKTQSKDVAPNNNL